jgi:hypothetical protein
MANQKTQRCIVIRAYRHKGETIGVGSVLDHVVPIAVELRTANKVSFVQADSALVSKGQERAPRVVAVDPAKQLAAAKKALAEAAALKASADNANEEADKKLAAADDKLAKAEKATAKKDKAA